jgi:hypothetical protein
VRIPVFKGLCFLIFIEITLFYNKKQAGQQLNGIPSAIFAGEDQQIGLVA